MRRSPQHADVRARAEDTLLQARDDDGVDFRMLEADALNRIGELDVHSQIVRIELEPVVGAKAAILLHIHRQGRDGALEGQLPVAIPVRRRLEVDGERGVGRSRFHPVKPTCGLEWLSRHYTAQYSI